MSCSREGCRKEAFTLQCPVCQKSGSGQEAFFCSQDCFKAAWPVHKLVHLTIGESIENVYNPYPDFKYTGKLRPYPLSARRTVPDQIRKPDYAETGYPAGEYEMKKAAKIESLSPEAIEKMRKVCKLGREVLDVAIKASKPGVTTDEIDRIVHEACIQRDCYPSPLNYQGFPKSCCTSVNEVICHGIPDKRPLLDGDILNIDISVYHDGYHADLNETIAIGTVDQKGLDLIDCARECLNEAIKLVRPGVMYREVGDVIEKYAKSKGFSVVKTYCGHGVNELFHCPPTIPHYAKNKAIGTMKAGHIFTIEPMINEGSWHDLLWPDDWTAVTTDGKRSAQFEHTLLVTETGCEILTK